MIDKRGFRANVGIVLINDRQEVFWGRRIGTHDAWQFPQGGIHEQESLEQAMYRELHEELGLEPQDVRVLALSQRWLSYVLPKQFRRHHSKPLCIGQKQKWFLLEFAGPEEKIRFDVTQVPEFISWRWVNYWHPLRQVIDFKRQIYKDILAEFEPLVLR